MRFVSVKEFRSRSGRSWAELGREREVVITSNGRPIAILSAVTEDNLEESLTAIRRARAMTAVAAMQQASVEAGTDRMTLDDINAVIAAERKARKHASGR